MINIKTFEINSQDFVLINDLEKGLLRGSIWGNLYEGYKFILENIGNLSEEQKMMLMLQVYAFTSLELSMYITTHPNNTEAIKTLKRVNIEKDKLKDLVSIVARNLKETGYFYLVHRYTRLNDIKNELLKNNLFINKQRIVFDQNKVDPVSVLLKISFNKSEIIEDKLTITR